MTTWTQPSDVIDAWIGDDAPTNIAQVNTWLEKAEREVRYRVADIQTRIDAESAETPARTDLLDLARDVVVAMVTRVFRNPEGVRQENVTTGPFTGSRTYGGNTPGALALTDEELAKLQGATGGAFNIDLIPSTSPFASGYVSPWGWL